MAFFSDGNRVTHHEFEKALYHLKEKAGFSHQQINRIRDTFSGDLGEEGSGRGISRHEFDRGIERLKESHVGEHSFHDDHIGHIEQAFGHYL